MAKAMKEKDFTTGPILGPLVRFMLPVLGAMILTSLYGAVDMLIVGRFGEPKDVSAVATGSMIMVTITNLANSFAMGLTIHLGQQIGQGLRKKSGETIGAGIFEFLFIGIGLSILMVVLARPLSIVMQAPKQALDGTVSYVRICGAGFLVIMSYALFGSIFRGIGDSATPLLAVGIATVVNILGDLLLVAVFKMGTVGAALATVFAQLVSVGISLFIISRRKLPFEFHLRMIRPVGEVIRTVTKLGAPLALQDFLVSISFLVIQAIVNSKGLQVSASVGVADRVCAFIMLVPSAFSQALSAFTAQNAGAGNYRRAVKSLRIAILLSLSAGIVMFCVSFFFGGTLCSIFTKEPELQAIGADYLKAYAFDCILTAFLFCFLGFYNGIGLTRFVMIQGIIGAFAIRIPIAWLMSRREPLSVFLIGFATPISTVVQDLMCLVCLIYVYKKYVSAQAEAKQ